MSKFHLPENIGPTAERLYRGHVERSGETVADVDGAIGDPFRSIGTLEIMLRRKTITREMANAGDQFHIEFQLAHLEPLKAADFAQTRVSGRQLSGLPRKIAEARDSIWRALQAMGGLKSPCGSIAWAVLGETKTLKKWSEEQGWSLRPVHPQAVTGIFIGTLGVLVAHYGLEKQENLV